VGHIDDLKTCSRRQAIRLAKQVGVEVSHPVRTGELLFSHEVHGRVRQSAGRRDASRALMKLLRRASRE